MSQAPTVESTTIEAPRDDAPTMRRGARLRRPEPADGAGADEHTMSSDEQLPQSGPCSPSRNGAPDSSSSIAGAEPGTHARKEAWKQNVGADASDIEQPIVNRDDDQSTAGELDPLPTKMVHSRSSRSKTGHSVESLAPTLASLRHHIYRLQVALVFLAVVTGVAIGFGAWFAATRGDKIYSSQIGVGAVESNSISNQAVTSDKLSPDVASAVNAASQLNQAMVTFSAPASSGGISSSVGRTAVEGVSFGVPASDFLFARPPAPSSVAATQTILRGQDSSGGGASADGGALRLQAGVGLTTEIQLQAWVTSDPSTMGAQRRLLANSNSNSNSNSASALRFDGTVVTPVTVVSIASVNATSSIVVQASHATVSTNESLSLASTAGSVSIAAGTTGVSGSITLSTTSASTSTAASDAAHSNGVGCDDTFPNLKVLHGCSGKGTTTINATGTAHIVLDSGDGAQVTATSHLILGSRINDTTIVAPKGSVTVQASGVEIRAANTSVMISAGDAMKSNHDDEEDGHGSSISAAGAPPAARNDTLLLGAVVNVDGVKHQQGNLQVGSTLCAARKRLVHVGQSLADDGSNRCPDDDSMEEGVDFHVRSLSTDVVVQDVKFGRDRSISNVSRLATETAEISELRVDRVIRSSQILPSNVHPWRGDSDGPRTNLPPMPVASSVVTRLNVSCNHSFVWLPLSAAWPAVTASSIEVGYGLEILVPRDNLYFWRLLAPINGSVNDQSYVLVAPTTAIVQCTVTETARFVCRRFGHDGRLEEDDESGHIGSGGTATHSCANTNSTCVGGATQAQVDRLQADLTDLAATVTLLNFSLQTLLKTNVALAERLDQSERNQTALLAQISSQQPAPVVTPIGTSAYFSATVPCNGGAVVSTACPSDTVVTGCSGWTGATANPAGAWISGNGCQGVCGGGGSNSLGIQAICLKITS